MEALGTIDTVIIDKTGTLTFIEPYVVGVVTCPGVDPSTFVRMAAVAERPSEHPLARAILKEAARLKIPVDEPDTFRYTPGKGVGSRGGEMKSWLAITCS
jgi:Cd2+/Zn2+-exporting ATPase/Cu+-exporting ATPase